MTLKQKKRQVIERPFLKFCSSASIKRRYMWATVGMGTSLAASRQPCTGHVLAHQMRLKIDGQ